MNANQLTTNIYAAGLVDEGLEVDRLIKENRILKQKIQSVKPICPICLSELTPFNYSGYYDSFAGYMCNCESFEQAQKVRGGYA